MTAGPTRIVAAVFLVLLVAAPAAAAQVDSGTAASIELAARSSWVSDTEPVTLDVRVGGDTAGTTMRVRVHPPLDDAADLATSHTEDVGGITRSVDLGPTEEIAVAAPGTRRVRLTGDDIRTPGVHPVVIELRSPEGGVLDLVRTPVIRTGTDDDPLAAPHLSIVMDFGVDPTVTPDGRRELTPTEIGRLSRLAGFVNDVAGLDPAPLLTMLTVPDTLDALATSSDPLAPELLDQLGDAASATQIAMPYVAVSAAALENAGIGDVLDTVMAVGALAPTERFGRASDPSLWPDDDVTPGAAARLVQRGVETILTSDSAAEEPGSGDPDLGDRLLTQAGPRPVPALTESGLSAVVVDEAASNDLVAGVGERVDAAPVAVADLLLRDAGRGSSVVIRVDDLPDESLLSAALPLLAAPDSPIPIVSLPVLGTDPDGGRVDPVTLPSGSTSDLRPIAEQFRTTERDVATFDGFAGPDSARAADLEVRQLTSVADGLETAGRVALLDSVEAVVAGGFDGITLTGQTDLNLTSRTGELPVAIANANDYPVRVMVRIRSDRLRFPDGEEIEVIAEPDVTRLDIRVEALATGSVPTFVEIRTPDGSLVLDDRQLNVRSTAVSGVGLALSLGALAVLAIWWVRTWRRSRGPTETSETRTV